MKQKWSKSTMKYVNEEPDTNHNHQTHNEECSWIKYVTQLKNKRWVSTNFIIDKNFKNDKWTQKKNFNIICTFLLESNEYYVQVNLNKAL